MDSNILLAYASFLSYDDEIAKIKMNEEQEEDQEENVKEEEEDDEEESEEEDYEEEEDEDVYDDSFWTKRVILAIVQRGPLMKLLTLEKSGKIREYPCRIPKKVTKKLNSLIIATDVTPDRVGGYLIDAENNTCEYYSFPTSKLPKCLQVKKHFNSAEFEMNNLAFALLYWEPLILERKRLHLYTDNNSIRKNGFKPEEGEKVRVYLQHFEKCEGVKLLNRRMHVNKNQRPAHFDKYIVPADKLSRGSVESFKEKIQNSFPKITKFIKVRPNYSQINQVRPLAICTVLPTAFLVCSCYMISYFNLTLKLYSGPETLEAEHGAL